MVAMPAWSRGGGLVVDSEPVVAWWRFPPLQPILSDRVRVLRWGTVVAANLVSRATNPTSLFYMALRDGGPPAVLGWASPIRT